MARISSYPFDLDVTDKDAWIGSNAGSRQTKQFTAEAVAKYLNIKGKISISAQMVFKFRAVAAQSGDFTGPTNGATFASITTMQLSIVDVSGQNVVKFMEYLVGNNILISKQNEISTFGHYTIDSYTDNGKFYTLNLSNLKGEGVLEDKAFYDFAVFTLSSQDGSTFEFDQGVPATTWNITHNLGKYPSASVTDSALNTVYGDVFYNDTNTLTITFNASFGGKAFLN